MLQADRVADLVNECRVAVLTRRMLETIGVTQAVVAGIQVHVTPEVRRARVVRVGVRRRGRAHEPNLPERAGRLAHFHEGAVDDRPYHAMTARTLVFTGSLTSLTASVP